MNQVKLRETPCLALIADMVGSRDLSRRQRSDAQVELSDFITSLNRKYASAILSRFVVTLGDEFQGLLSDATVLPDLFWDLHYNFAPRALRSGIGFGRIDTAIGRNAINVDGPALHNARDAIVRSRKERIMGGVFSGFGEVLDIALNGYARLLHFQRSGLKRQQRRVVELLRRSLTQSAIAEELGVSKQAVSLYASAAGWIAYRDGESGFRMLLSQVDMDL